MHIMMPERSEGHFPHNVSMTLAAETWERTIERHETTSRSKSQSLALLLAHLRGELFEEMFAEGS
jgi:hypothetical protein